MLNYLQCRKFTLSLKIAYFKEQPWAIHSCRSLQKSDHEQFAHIALYKRATWANCTCYYLKKSDVSDSRENLSKNQRFARKFVFFLCFWQFSPLLCQEQITHITLLSFTLFKERLERVAPVAHYKRATVIDALTLLFKKEQKWELLKKKSESHFHSFAQKKRAICSKNWWANSQP